MEILVEDFDVGRALDVTSSNRSSAARVETQRDSFFGQASDDDVLQVQDDVGDVFSDTTNRVELVQCFVEANRHDGGARDRREESTTE